MHVRISRALSVRRVKQCCLISCVALLLFKDQIKVPQTRSQYAAVMMHTAVEAFEPALENLIDHLDTRWTVYMFMPVFEGRSGSVPQFQRAKAELLRLHIVKRLLDAKVQVTVRPHLVSDLPMDISDNSTGKSGSGPVLANHFALSSSTYEAITEEHILFFQQDSIVCERAPNDRSLDSFMHHLWLGAPWLAHKSFRALDGSQLNLIYGNGGFSVRDKSFVLECMANKEYRVDLVESRSGKGLPEDIFFSRCLFEHHRKQVDVDEAIAFSSEEIVDPEFPVLALHDPCRVSEGPSSVGCSSAAHVERTKFLLQRCPQVKRSILKCVRSCVT